MISSRPSHMSTIIVSLETSPSGANEPNGPVIPNPGPTFPSAVAETRQRVERAERHVADRGVDRDDRGADDPDADVEEDEGRDRAQRALVDRRAVQPNRACTTSGLTVWSSSRRRILPTRRWRTTLIEPVVEPAEPPTNISAKIVSSETSGQSAKSSVAIPGRRDDRDGLEDAGADRLLALRRCRSPRSGPSARSTRRARSRGRAGTPRRARTRRGRRRTNPR